MALAPRDDRAVHDQIIQHDLVGVGADQLARLTIIELRKLREVLYVLLGNKEDKADG